MKTSPYIFCDWLTAKQTHAKHPPLYGGETQFINAETGEIKKSLNFKSHQGLYNSNLQIRSDGETVEVSGNPSRFDRQNNVHGLNLDQAKTKINDVLLNLGLPIFTDGITLNTQSENPHYTGAKITRIDMTTNLKFGNPTNQRHYQMWLQSQTFPRLDRQSWDNLNVYFGKASDSRTFRIYDKARHIIENDGDKKLASALAQAGVLRYEWEYRKFLKLKGYDLWHKATQKNLSKQFLQDIKPMTKRLKKIDLEELPSAVLKTYLIYEAGINPRDHVGKNQYWDHKKILKGYGIDIADQKIRRIKTPTIIIQPEPFILSDEDQLLEG